MVALASLATTAGAGALTADAAVHAQMCAVLPLVAATLATHGTAVTLEGLLLARRDFRALALTYAAIGASVGGLLALVRGGAAASAGGGIAAAAGGGGGGGLLGVWAVYVWYCAVRVVAFAAFGGLLGRGKSAQRSCTASAGRYSARPTAH